MTVHFHAHVDQVNINEGSAPQTIVQNGAGSPLASGVIRDHIARIDEAIVSMSPERQAEMRARLAELKVEPDRARLHEKARSWRQRLAEAGQDYGAVRQALGDLVNVLASVLPS